MDQSYKYLAARIKELQNGITPLANNLSLSGKKLTPNKTANSIRIYHLVTFCTFFIEYPHKQISRLVPKYSSITHVPGDRGVKRTSSRALSRTFAMQLWQRNTRRNAALQRAPRQRVRVCVYVSVSALYTPPVCACVRVRFCGSASERALGAGNTSRTRRAPQMRPQFRRGKTWRCPFTIAGKRVDSKCRSPETSSRDVEASSRENIENATWSGWSLKK